MSELSNDRFLNERYAEYLEEGYDEEEARLMARLDFEEAGDLADDVY